MSLRNIDRTDREMLLACAEVQDKNGLIRSADVAEFLGVGATKHRTPAGRVSTRLSWMARGGYELLVRVDPKAWGFKSNEAIWLMTDFGKEVMDGGTLPQALMAQIANGSAGRRLKIMQELSSTGAARGPELNILRRQWNHDWARYR